MTKEVNKLYSLKGESRSVRRPTKSIFLFVCLYFCFFSVCFRFGNTTLTVPLVPTPYQIYVSGSCLRQSDTPFRDLGSVDPSLGRR